MGRIIKALIVGWIGKKIYDYTLGRDSAPEAKPAPVRAAAKRTPRRTTTRTVRAH